MYKNFVLFDVAPERGKLTTILQTKILASCTPKKPQTIDYIITQTLYNQPKSNCEDYKLKQVLINSLPSFSVVL